MKRFTAVLLILVFLTPMTAQAGVGGGAEVNQNGVGHWNEGGGGGGDECALDMGWIADFLVDYAAYVSWFDMFAWLRK